MEEVLELRMTLYMRESFISSLRFNELLGIDFGIAVLGGKVPLVEL
jgi:hypothetical protein